LKDYLKEETGNYNITEEHDKKLKFAIWDQMEFLSEEMRIDNPKKVIDTIRDTIEEYFLEYCPMDERFDD